MRDFAVCAWYHAQCRAVNLSLSSELIAEARRAKLNLSAIAEDAIGAALTETDLAAERFKQEIARSVAEHEAYLDQYGSLADAVHAVNTDNAAG